MTTQISPNIPCKAKVKGLYLALLCLHLTMAEVPGSCRYSVTKDHLTTVRHLIENQLKNGCLITYTFTERRNLSDTCFIKAAFPQILELIDTHFQYSRSSDNGRYIEALKAVIHNVYSQKCISPTNEELEEDPAKFSRTYRGSPREALERVLEVLSLYLEQMSTRNTPVDWSCEDEYARDETLFSTPATQATDSTKCQCITPPVVSVDSHQKSETDSSLWKRPSQATDFPSVSHGASGQDSMTLGMLDIVAVPWRRGGTSTRMTYGGVSGKSPLLRTVRAEHPTGHSSPSSNKMAAFPAAMETSLSSAEPYTSYVFSMASKSTDDTSVPYNSQRYPSDMDSSHSTSDLGDHSSSAAFAVSSTRGTTKFVTDSLISRGSSRPLVPTSFQEAFMGSQYSAAPRQKSQVEGTYRRRKAGSTVSLAKRSLGPKQYKSPAGPSSSAAYSQRGTASTSELPSVTSVILGREKAVLGPALDHFSSIKQSWQRDNQPISRKTAAPTRTPKTWLRTGHRQMQGLSVYEIRQTPSPDLERDTLSLKTAHNGAVGTADPVEQKAKMHFQTKDPEESHDSKMLSYIMPPVCGGLLLISAIYCLRRQKGCFMQHRDGDLQACPPVTAF
ncbi:hypothetical protein GJAV_G00185160 [Gymnothorax javanicus]|nr:hypothetical protein GJAV_G00185160 [Gymnothorax javanicus]